jgi:hypothetical protein
MMTQMDSVFVKNIKADKTMEIVRELRAMGLVQGKDFEFKYLQAQWDYYGDNQIRDTGGAEFYFREGKWRTYIALKYAS